MSRWFDFDLLRVDETYTSISQNPRPPTISKERYFYRATLSSPSLAMK